MIDIKKYPILKDNLSTLKETSKDKHDNDKIRYMTYSVREAIDFDGVKEDYIKDLGLEEVPSSNDALFVNKNKELVFIEFKNGKMDNRKYSVWKKIYDSIIILTGVLNTGIGNLRDNMEYILVYNEQANEGLKDIQDKKTYVQDSGSFNKIANTFGNLAGQEYVCFGIRMFEKYCFKKVHTYSKEEFEKYLKEN